MTHSIAVSINRNYTGKLAKESPHWEDHTTSFQLETLDASGIGEAIRQGYAIAAAHHTRRHTDNFMSAQHLGLDFDSEDERSTLAALTADPFIGQYGAIVHTTSSHRPEAPRARVIFILDKPVRDAATYSRYAEALVGFFNQSDQKCKDAARLFFGAPGCDMIVDENRVLPLSVLDELVAQYEATQQRDERGQGAPPTRDPMKLLDVAVREGVPGNRHNAGFQLCRGLRDIGLSREDATPIAQSYQMAVQDLGDHPYTWREAWASLSGAYSRTPRKRSNDELERILVDWECSAWFERRGLKEGGIHYSLKTVMAVSEIMRKAGRTTNVDLPVRDFIAYGVKKDTARNHLEAMVEAGILRKERKSNFRRGTSYSIIPAEKPQTPASHSFDVAMTATYKQLQDMPHFSHGARIDPRLWVSEPPTGVLGPVAQRIIAALSIMGNESNSHAQNLDNQKEGEIPSLRDCLSSAHDPSMGQLWKMSGVSARTGEEKFKLLVKLGVCAVETSPDNHKAKIPSLTDNWFGRLNEIAPALTTFGRIQLTGFNYAGQRLVNHERFSLFGRQEDRQLSATVADNAEVDQEEFDRQVKALNAQRMRWAVSQGINPQNVPSITLHAEPRPQPVQQPVGAHGRKVIPKTAKTDKNRKMAHELDARIALRWFDELSDGRPLLEGEAVELRNLANNLGLSVNIERIELT